jgi:cysteine-rich repeat protein
MFKNKRTLFIIGAVVSMAVVLTLPFISKNFNSDVKALSFNYTSLNPADTVMDVPVAVQPLVTFNEPIKAVVFPGEYVYLCLSSLGATMNDCIANALPLSLNRVDPDGAGPAPENSALRIIPQNPLGPNHSYTIYFDVCNEAQTLCVGKDQWNFTTAAAPADPLCGNGYLERQEQCDDGGTSDGDGCSSICEWETPPPPFCGDGMCNGDDNCSNCEQDCGACPPSCGDGMCNGDDNCSNCEQDCGPCGGGCVQDPACDAPCDGGPGYSPDNGQTCFSDDQCANICQMGQKPAFIFITSGLGNGNTAGIAGATGACAGAAANAGLDGTWKALISDSTHNVADVLPDKPYALLNGVPVAGSKADLLDGLIMNPIYITELGTPYADISGHPGLAWTGSDSSGNYAVVDGYQDLACNGWTSGSSDSRAIAGLANKTDADWIDGIPENDGAMHCDQSAALYCFSGDSSGMSGQEICDNGIDDNDNQLVDCADPQCSKMPACGGQGGQCISMNGTLDGDNPFAGGQGEVCDGTAFWPDHDTCEAFGYTGGTLGCTICKPDFSQCTGGGGQTGTGMITVSLTHEDGNFYFVDEDTSVVAVCGNTTVQMPAQGGPATAQSDTFYSGATIPKGDHSTTIMGIPTPQNGEIFSNPCLVFLGKSSGLTLGSQYTYFDGVNPVGWTDYSKNTDMDKPMPPMAKYAPVSLGDDNDQNPRNPGPNAANLYMKVQPLNPGDLTGYVCLDLDKNGVCTPLDGINEFLPDMTINIFPMGDAPAGFATPAPYTTDETGYYVFNNLPGGDYIIQASGEKMYIGTVHISGNTSQDLVVSLGKTLSLNLDDTSDCWLPKQHSVNYSFWPQNWNFDSKPVMGEAAFDDFTDNQNETYSLDIQGFNKGVYNAYIEVPGCLSIKDAVVDLSQQPAELDEELTPGITISGTVVDESGNPVSDFNFGAQTVFDPTQPKVFGGFVGTKTLADDPDTEDVNEAGHFELRGLAEGDWTFESFEGSLAASQRSFAPGAGSLNEDGAYTVGASGASDVVLVLRDDKRVNITITDGINLVTDARMDILCGTGKYVHLGMSDNAWTFLPPGDTCYFSVHSRSADYDPLENYPVVITAGTQPQDISIMLNHANSNQGVYTGSTFKSDKTTTYPEGKVTYTGKITAPDAADLAGKTVTFTYPAAAKASGDGTLITNVSAGTCTNGSGTVTCAIPDGYTDTSYTISSQLTVASGFTGNNISTSLNIASTSIGNVYVEVISLSVNAPSVVSSGKDFTVYGLAYPDATVTLSYIDDAGVETTVGSTVMDPGSTWYTFNNVNITAARGHNIYTLKATAVGEGATASVTRNIIVGGATPNLANITMTVNGADWPYSQYTGIPTGLIFEGTPFTINLTFSGTVKSVTGAFNGRSYDFTNTDDDSWRLNIPAGWTGYGDLTVDITVTWDDDNNPDTPDVTVLYGTVVGGSEGIDPSGYVYDTTDANRIPGVSATVYQLVAGASHASLSPSTVITEVAGADDGTGGGISGNGIIENGEEGTVSGFAVGKITGCGAAGVLDTTLCTWSQWDAAPSGQISPQVTDSNGHYGWNVPVGWYRVSFQKANPDGYALSYSRDVYVPPAETGLNLNLGAYDIGAPAAATNPANAAIGIARNVDPTVFFSEPMLAGTINTTNVQLLDSTLTPVAITVTYDPGNNTATLAPVAPPLAATATYTIKVTTGVADDSGNALGAELNNTFQTGAGTDVAAPTSAATPASTAFTGSQIVTLGADDGLGAGTCADCIIYYTTDGTAPTASSSVYTGALTFTSTKTLKFFAKDAAGNTEVVANTETYTLTSIPNTPTGIVGGSLTNGCSLNWDDMLSAASYKVYRSTTSGSGYTLLASPTSSLYADYAVTGGTPYYYKVSAVNGIGESGLSAEVSVTPLASAQQQVVTTTSGGGGMSLPMLLKNLETATGETGMEGGGETVTTKFLDIAGHWAESYIKNIESLGIISGKTADTYAPDAAITRAELTKMAIIAFNYKTEQPKSAPFNDVESYAWYAPYILAARDSNIVQGYSGNFFKPNNPINRAEALTILIKAAGFQVDPNAVVSFTDTPSSSWYMPYLAYAKNNGIISGYADGTFGPGKSITRAEVAKIVSLILEMK